MQRQHEEGFETDGAPPIERRSPSPRPGSGRAWSPGWRVAAGVLASALASVLGIVVLPQSSAMAVGWFLIAAVVLAVPVARARRIMRARRTPDAATAGQVLQILTGLDEVEHRAVELGPAWPRLSVGPTGVLVIDVCPAGSSSAPARRVEAKVLRGHLARTARTGRAARRALDDAGVDIPVHTLAVTPSVTASASAEVGPVRLIDPRELSVALSAGPALPMAVVDAAFTSLTRTDGLVAD